MVEVGGVGLRWWRPSGKALEGKNSRGLDKAGPRSDQSKKTLEDMYDGWSKWGLASVLGRAGRREDIWNYYLESLVGSLGLRGDAVLISSNEGRRWKLSWFWGKFSQWVLREVSWGRQQWGQDKSLERSVGHRLRPNCTSSDYSVFREQ